MSKKIKGKSKLKPSFKNDLIQKLIRVITSTGISVGPQSHIVHPSISKYVHKHVDGTAIIDLTTTCRNLLSLYKLIRLLVERKHMIMIVANNPDHSRIASFVFKSMPSNVNVLIKRWSPGMFSNFKMFSVIVHVFKRISIKNKSETMKRQYASKYGPIHDFYLRGKIPRLIIFIDVVGIDIAMAEAKSMGITTVGFANIDFKKSNMLTYVMPIGHSIRGIAFMIAVLRRFIKKAVNSIVPVSTKKDSSHDDARTHRVYGGKKKWINKKPMMGKSARVGKYLEWIKHRKARKMIKVLSRIKKYITKKRKHG